jgi:hypothetical protein
MDKARCRLSLGMVIVVVAAGLLVGRSQAQPEPGQRADPPFFLKIGELRINPSQVTCVQTQTSSGEKTLHVAMGVQIRAFQFGTDGQAEALLQWFEAHSTEIKPKPLNPK